MGILDGIGDFMQKSDDAVNNFIADHYSPYADWLKQSRQNYADEKAAGVNREWYDVGSHLYNVEGALRTNPVSSFVVDFGNRTTDTIANAASYAGYEDTTGHGSAWATLLDRDTWDQAWNSWGSPTHVSAGDLFAANVNNSDNFHTLNPFDAHDSIALQQQAHETWYGTAIAATTDLAAGFIAPPGLGLVKAAHAADEIVNADKVFDAYQSAKEAGVLSDLKSQKRLDTLKIYVGAKADPNSQLARLVQNVNHTYDLADETEMLNHLSPLMQNSGESAKTFMASAFTEANRLDPNAALDAKVNMLLAPTSKGAREALTSTSPIIARMMENYTGSPKYAGLAQDMWDARQVEGVDYNLGAIVDRNFGLAGDKAEIDALKKRLTDEQAVQAQKADIRSKLLALRPTLRSRLQPGEHGDIKVKKLPAGPNAGERFQATAKVHRADGTVGTVSKIHADQTEAVNGLSADLQGANLKHNGRGPLLDNFDVARLKESREMAATNVQRLQSRLAAAKAELKGNDRWVGAEEKAANGKPRFVPGQDGQLRPSGQPEDVANLSTTARSAGQHQGHIDEIQAQLAQAKEDLALFQQTPLQNVTDLEEWKKAIANARDEHGDAYMSKRWTEAEIRTREEAYKAKLEDVETLSPGLGKANDFLGQMKTYLDQSSSGYGVGSIRADATRLDAAKTRWRAAEGEFRTFKTPTWVPDVVVRVLPHPADALRAIGSPRARGGINLAEADKGARELNESLLRSKEFSPDEARNWTNHLISTPPGAQRVKVVQDAETEMLTRVAMRHYGGRLSPEDAMKQAKADVALGQKVYGKGRAYLLGKVQEQGDTPFTFIRDLEGNPVAFDTATLQSHLADTAPFVDPSAFKLALKANESKVAAGLINAREMVGFVQQIWKHSVLLRPGLAARALLDEGLRSTALIGAAAQAMDTVNGALKIGAKMPGIAGIVNHSDRLQQMFKSMDTFHVPISATDAVDFSTAADRAQRAALQIALTKGGTIPGALLSNARNIENKLVIDRSSWKKYKAGDPNWATAYAEQAQVMLASPVVRRMLADAKSGDLRNLHNTVDDYAAELMRDPAVRAEYDAVARRGTIDAPKPGKKAREAGVRSANNGLTQGEFVEQVLSDVEKMFPDPKLADELASRDLTGKSAKNWIEKNFPKDSQFDVPGPESVLRPNNIKNQMGNALNTFYRLAMDKPNFWLVRHPVYKRLYQQELQGSARELLAQKTAEMGESASITPDELRRLDMRAKTKAGTQVRNTFFDTTRNSGAGEHLSLIAPFFAAWEDAMMSWSRLVYDDPKRLFKLMGAWNSFENVTQHAPEGSGWPLVVDQNGNRVTRSQQTNGPVYIQVPIPFSDNQTIRIRKDALNSIAQGEVPWLPGFGPVATVSTTFLLNRLPQDLKFALAQTDTPGLAELRDSMYMNGEIPAEVDPMQMALPAWMRNVVNDTWGKNYGANVVYNMNQQYIDSLRTGVPMDINKARSEAERQARTAGIVRMISTGVFGMSGPAQVDGQFYVDKMHEYNSLTADQLKAAGVSTPDELFAKNFPEAADLKWRISKNETGINATVTAEQAASQHKGLINDHPENGWFILGADNVAGEFSGTAYNQQLAETYGVTDLGRKRQDPGDSVHDAQVAMGWKDYNATIRSVEQIGTEVGASKELLSAVKTQVINELASKNRGWSQDFGTRTDRLGAFFRDADAIAASDGIKDRPDMQEYVQYRSARQQILDTLGLKSFTGTSANAETARTILSQVGETMSASDPIAFKQMWDRMLSSEAAQ